MGSIRFGLVGAILEWVVSVIPVAGLAIGSDELFPTDSDWPLNFHWNSLDLMPVASNPLTSPITLNRILCSLQEAAGLTCEPPVLVLYGFDATGINLLCSSTSVAQLA